MGRFIETKGLKFEVWEKSIRLIKPEVSPMFFTHCLLTKDEFAMKAIDDFIEIMNIGIGISRNFKI